MSDHSHALHREMEAAKVLKAHLKDLVGDDEETLRDTIEGETRLQELIALVMEEISADVAAIDGIKAHVEKLKGRCERLDARVEGKRQAVLAAMEMAEVRRMDLAIATVTRKAAPPKVVVKDEALIPSKFWVRSDPRLDKKALLDALKDKESVSGAELSNGGEALQIRWG